MFIVSRLTTWSDNRIPYYTYYLSSIYIYCMYSLMIYQIQCIVIKNHDIMISSSKIVFRTVEPRNHGTTDILQILHSLTIVTSSLMSQNAGPSRYFRAGRGSVVPWFHSPDYYLT